MRGSWRNYHNHHNHNNDGRIPPRPSPNFSNPNNYHNQPIYSVKKHQKTKRPQTPTFVPNKTVIHAPPDNNSNNGKRATI